MGVVESSVDFVDLTHSMGYRIGEQATTCVIPYTGIHVPTVPADLDEMADPREKSVADSVGIWMLLSVVPRLESRIVSDLECHGIMCFWPRETIRVPDRDGNGRQFLRRVQKPIFPGYISACVQADSDVLAIREWRSNGIGIGVRPIVNQRKFVEELQTIETVFKYCPNALVQPGLRNGDLCRIIAGPMLGIEGMLLDRETGPKFVVLARFMGGGSTIEIDPEFIEKIELL